MNTKTLIHKTAIILLIGMMVIAALPVTPAGAVSANITSVSSGTWEATAWPNTLRSGTITVTAGNATVTGSGTAFLTELSVGNIIKTTGNIQIGTVAAIASDTSLTLTKLPATTRTNIAYHVQGVGPADNVTIAATHSVTIAARAVNQTGTVTVNSGGTLTVSNPGAVFSVLTVDGTVTGTSGSAFGALTVNSGGSVTAGTSGTYSASSLTINGGGTMNVSRAFTVSGPTSITGTIHFSSTSVTSRAIVFMGPVTLNSGAVWTEPASGNGANNTYDFQDDLANDASTFITSGTAVHTFSGAGKTISGGSNTAIARVVISGTYTNSGTLSIGTTLSGAGSLSNDVAGTLNLGGISSISTLANAGTLTKTGAGPITTALANFTNTGTLNLNGTGIILGITNSAGGTVNLTSSGAITTFDNATATSTLNIFDLSVPHFGTLIVSTAGNIVNYSGAGAQTVKRITYSNLVFSGSGAKSISMPSGSTLASSGLSIAPTGTAVANITGTNLTVTELMLGGSGKAAGTWGSSASAATNQDDNFFAATTGYLNVTNDTRIPQIITFTSAAPVDAAVGGPTYTPTATGGPSGNPVVFTIDPTAASVCSISAGVVSFLANGTCVIDADQAGDTNYLAASQQQSFDVKTNQTISFTSTAPVDAAVGGPTYTPAATATSGLTVTFTIDPTAASVCSISAGVVSFDAVGTCVIDADQAGDATFHAAPQVQQSFSVGKGDQTITFTSLAPVGATVGGPTYTPTATATSGLTVTFTIDPTAASVCSISAGVVSFDTVGTCVIDADQAGDANFDAAPQVQQSFVVDVTSYWLPWYSNNASQNTMLRIGNIGGSTATVHIFIGGTERTPISGMTVLAGTSKQVSYPVANQGPVQVVSDVPLVVSERVIFKVSGMPTSSSEMMGLPDSQLDTTYWLPWYTNNASQSTMLRIGNVGGSGATVHIFIAGTERTPVSGMSVPAGTSSQVSFASVNQGPVQIVSDVPVVVSERVILKVSGTPTSSSETMGLPDSQLDTTYWLPRYTNNASQNTMLRIGNIGGSTATVHIFIGGTERTPVSGMTVLAGTSSQVSFASVNQGPVQIVSDVPVVVSERVIYKVSGTPTSSSEILGLPAGQLHTTYWLPWYTNNASQSTMLRIGNVGGSTATVHIFIGGTERTPVSGISILTGTSGQVSFASMNQGPVQIVSDMPVVVSERVIYTPSGMSVSLSEMK